jgi:hypothetical protein
MSVGRHVVGQVVVGLAGVPHFHALAVELFVVFRGGDLLVERHLVAVAVAGTKGTGTAETSEAQRVRRRHDLRRH